MIQQNWYLLNAALALLTATTVVAQTPPTLQPETETEVLTAVTGTNLEEVIVPTPNQQTLPTFELNSQTQVSVDDSFSTVSLNTSIGENVTLPFQDTTVIIADSSDRITDSEWTSGRPDGHAPIGVMGDHVHEAGEWMVSYRYMFMAMAGNRDGTDNLSTDEVLRDFMVTPEDMTMQMHMFGAMYAPTDDLTLMVMLPFVSKQMDHRTRSGVEFTTNSGGLGDIKFTGLYNVLRENRQRVHLNFGVSFPTGSIDERDDTPAGNDQILPYPMQIGSGTFDLLPGITYLGQTDDWSWGTQLNTAIRLGQNSRDYSLGNRYQLTTWVGRQWTEQVSTSLRLSGQTWGNYDGADSSLNPMMIPTADPELRGGTRLDLGLGINVYFPEGFLAGGRLGVEFEFPVYQSLEGPQLETDWQLTAGLQYSF
ncbi:MAG: transporter [Oscillatoria sp. PMC 1051.18]|nr:transporter [Oscillatoria sp. PMC 1050.18]MEC5029030.1 transporter [Oscillatoria sp. PMC 1051.18]